MISTTFKNFQMLIITGNPIALEGHDSYKDLEDNLYTQLSAVVINSSGFSQADRFRSKLAADMNNKLPYPKPMTLLSREI
jgi:hypothetical protein